MQRGIYKKLTEEDKFARRYYCKHARLGTIRYQKKKQHRDIRKLGKAEIRQYLEGESDVDFKGLTK